MPPTEPQTPPIDPQAAPPVSPPAAAVAPDMHAIADALEHDHTNIERGIFISLVVALLLAGGLLFWVNRHQKHVYGMVPAPTPISVGDVNGMLPAFNTALSEADANLSGLDTALNDQQGNLSE